MIIEKEKGKKLCRRFLSPFKTLFIWFPQCNTAVRTSCMHERINFRQPLATFPRKIIKKTQETTLSHKIGERKLKLSEEFVKGIESRGRENSKLFEHKAYSSTGILLICYSVLSFGNTKLYSFITS